MASGGKGGGGGGNNAYDYEGTIACLFCMGPASELVGLIADGKEIWPGAQEWKSGQAITVTDLRHHKGKTWKARSSHTASGANEPPNGTYWDEYTLARGASVYTDLSIQNYGPARFYWGTTSQTTDPRLQVGGNDAGEQHPSYQGLVYIVLKDFLFGRERTSPPNIEAVIRCEPQQTTITGAPSTLVDGQANAAAVLAQLITDPVNGLGIPTGMVDATSFQATADALQTVQEVVNVSMLIDSKTNLRSILTDLSQICDIWLRFNPSTKKIECGRFTHGANPSVYSTLSIDDCEERPVFSAGGWKEVRTGAQVVFPDRERAFKETSQQFDDVGAFEVLGEHRRDTLNRSQITRRSQAYAHAAEAMRTLGRPSMSSSDCHLRREKGRPIRPGDWVQLDIDPEPGGAQLLLQFFKVLRRTIQRDGRISLELDADETLSPITFTPPVAGSTVPIPGFSAAIPNARIFEAPSLLSGVAGQLGFLCERPNLMTVGVQVWYNDSGSGSYQMLGHQTGFPVRCILGVNYTDSDTGVVNVQTPAQADIELMSRSITAVEAEDDSLIAILIQYDTGTPPQIATASDGQPYMEIMSISDIDLISAGVYELTVARSRRGTRRRTWTTTDTEIWIINREMLTFFGHQQFETLRSNLAASLTPDTAHFLLQGFTAYDTYDLGSITDIPFEFNATPNSAPIIDRNNPTWDDQQLASGSIGSIVGIDGTVTDFNNNLYEVQVVYSKDGANEIQLYRAFTEPEFHTFNCSLTLASAGTYVVTVIAIDRAGVRVRDEMRIVLEAAGTQMPGVSCIRHYAPTHVPVSLVAFGSTLPRASFDDDNFRLRLVWSPEILSSGGMIEINATSTAGGAPGAGWLATSIYTINSNTVDSHTWELVSGTSPVATISAAWPAAFKLWVRVTNPGNANSTPQWLIFS